MIKDDFACFFFVLQVNSERASWYEDTTEGTQVNAEVCLLCLPAPLSQCLG